MYIVNVNLKIDAFERFALLLHHNNFNSLFQGCWLYLNCDPLSYLTRKGETLTCFVNELFRVGEGHSLL